MTNRRIFKSAIAGFALLFFSPVAHGIDPNRAIAQCLRERWGRDSGFPGGSVTAIAQTADGYLWIGTDKGLIRFDGLNFRLFPQAIPESFPIGPVQQLLADAQGNLWILLQSTGILRYHDEKFELGRDQAEFGITAMVKQRNGAVLFSSLAYGALTYNAGSFEVIPSPPVERSNSAALTGTNDDLSSRLSWDTGVAAHRIAAPSAITSMAETDDGKMWLGTRDKGLFYLSGGRMFSARNGLLNRKISCLLALGDYDLWIGTDRGLIRWNDAVITSDGVPPSLRNVQILSMIRDRDSNIWVGTSDGLIRVTAQEVSVDRSSSPVNEPVTALFEDREHNLWVGSSGGIERLRDSAFITYSVADGLPSERNGPVYLDAQGRTWFAPLGGGLYSLKRGRVESVTEAGLAHDVVYSIAGRGDELWLGRQHGGLTLLREHNGSVTAKTYTQAEGLVQDSVYSVHQSRDGAVWAGTLSGGVSELRNGRFTTYTTANGLSSNTVMSIAEGSDGTMWFATANGLSALSNGRWRVFTISDGLRSPDLNCLAVDSAGVLWIGSPAGLAFFASNRVQVPRDLPESLREQIFGIAEDKHGWLWIATSNRVLRVNRRRLLDGRLTNSDIREYGLADGLNGTEGVKRDQSVVADASGRIWFSMNRGLSVVDPSRLASPSVPALVHIDEISADGNPIPTSTPIRVPSARQRITFSYTALSLSDPERVRYRYRLEGFDRDWSEPVTTRSAVYTNLSPGSYLFRVIARNSEGIWNDAGAAVRFSVAPAWYQTNWFRLLGILSALCLAWALYQLRVRQIAKAMSARFDERLAERTRLARELHDTLLQTIQGSKLVADDALDTSTDPVRLRRAVEQLSLWLGQAMQEGRAALNSLRISTTQTNDLAQGLRQATQDGLVPSSMTVNFSVIGDAKEMHPIVRDEVYRIGYEAIRNASAHSRASQLDVELTYAQDLALRVADNGIGIDPAIAERGKDGHFGLRGMRERAGRIGGRLTLSSSGASGTEIRLVVSGAIIFRKPTAVRQTILRQ